MTAALAFCGYFVQYFAESKINTKVTDMKAEKREGQLRSNKSVKH